MRVCRLIYTIIIVLILVVFVASCMKVNNGPSRDADQANTNANTSAPATSDDETPCSLNFNGLQNANGISTSEILLGWDAATGNCNSVAYRIYDFSNLSRAIATSTSTSYTVKNLDAEQEYSFLVKAVGDLHEFPNTVMKSASTLSTDPTCSLTFDGITTATALSYNQIQLNWNAAVGCEGETITYRVYNSSDMWSPVVTTENTYVNISGLTQQTTYSYIVRPYVDDHEYSDMDVTKEVTTLSKDIPVFTGLTSVTYDGANQFTLTWPTVSDTSYTMNIYYSGLSGKTLPNEPYTSVSASTNPSGTTLTLPCSDSSTYYFIVKAEKNNFEDTNTSEKSVSTTTCNTSVYPDSFQGLQSLTMNGKNKWGDIYDVDGDGNFCDNNTNASGLITGKPSITLSWNKAPPTTNGANITYYIYRTTNGSPFDFSSPYATTTQSTYTDSCESISEGNIYYYNVRAYYTDTTTTVTNTVMKRTGYASYMSLVTQWDESHMQKTLFATGTPSIDDLYTDGTHTAIDSDEGAYIEDFFIDTYEAGCDGSVASQKCGGAYIYTNVPGYKPYNSLSKNSAYTACANAYVGNMNKRLPTNYEWFMAARWTDDNDRPFEILLSNDNFVELYGNTLSDAEINSLEGINGYTDWPNYAKCNTYYGGDLNTTDDVFTGDDHYLTGTNGETIVTNQNWNHSAYCRSYYGPQDMVGNMREWVWDWLEDTPADSTAQNNNIDAGYPWSWDGIVFDNSTVHNSTWTYYNADIQIYNIQFNFVNGLPVASGGTTVNVTDIHQDYHFMTTSYSTNGAWRGGDYTSGRNAGRFMIFLKGTTNSVDSKNGFRCSLHPSRQ